MNNKKEYIKPQMDELQDVNMNLLAGSELGTDVYVSRQEYSDFTEDDLDSEE